MKRFFLIKIPLALFFALAAIKFVQAQTVQITLGPDEIGENQAWTITATIQNERFKSTDLDFPDIPGFRKRGTSSQSQTSIVNGQVSSSSGIVMTYLPTKQGTFTLPAFKMKINDQMFSSPGKKIKVGPPVQNQQRDPFRNFYKDNKVTMSHGYYYSPKHFVNGVYNRHQTFEVSTLAPGREANPFFTSLQAR